MTTLNCSQQLINACEWGYSIGEVSGTTIQCDKYTPTSLQEACQSGIRFRRGGMDVGTCQQIYEDPPGFPPPDRLYLKVCAKCSGWSNKRSHSKYGFMKLQLN